MKKYSVLLTRDATESATVEVEAEDMEGAGDRALEVARDGGLDWKLNESCNEEAYMGGGWPPEEGGDVTEIKEGE